MFMDSARREYIAELASAIRDSMNLQSPIDLEGLVSELGGQILYQDQLDENMEALIQKTADSFEIILDQNKIHTRQRFSIAHEIGHLFLHMGYLVNPEKWNTSNEYVDSVYYRFGYNTEESEANEFAASLLMPSNEFREVAYANLHNSEFNVKPIADYFNVSKEAVVNRGRFLGLFRG